MPSRSVSPGSSRRTTATIASTSDKVTSLKARTVSSETFRSRLSGACASRSQNSPRAVSVRAKAPAAEILVKIAKRRDIPYHLPLGVTAAEASIRLDEQLLAQDRKWRAVSRSADFTEPYPAEFPPDTAD